MNNLAEVKARLEAGIPPTNEEVMELITDLEEHRAAISVVIEACGKAMMQTEPDKLETLVLLDPGELLIMIAEAAGVS